MLTGAGVSFNSSMPPASVSGIAIHGGGHGGQPGIISTHVYL